jgi:hypothetical protein
MAEPEKPAEGGAAPAPDSPPAAGKGIPPVFLKGELEIYPDQRLGHLDQETLKAFSAKAKDGTPSFALICERGLVPQPQLAVKYYSINTPFLPKLVGFGTVFWPLENQERFVFVYENKLGKPIASADNRAGWSSSGGWGGMKKDFSNEENNSSDPHFR